MKQTPKRTLIMVNYNNAAGVPHAKEERIAILGELTDAVKRAGGTVERQSPMGNTATVVISEEQKQTFSVQFSAFATFHDIVTYDSPAPVEGGPVKRSPKA